MIKNCQAILQSEKRRTKWPIAFILLTFSFFLLLVLGNDSPLLLMYDHVDSSWFFMGGKALMNGLIPYVDFTDSKGPLLWLIYGIGYLLSPTDFNGIFIIGIILYWGIFILTYKTAFSFLDSSAKALLVTVLSSIFFFMPVIHDEIRAEDFNQFFNIAILYSIVMLFINGGSIVKYGILLGICLGGSLLLKFSFTILSSIPIVMIILYELSQSARKGVKFLGFIIAGFSLFTMPFVIYLVCIGAFKDFIHEYFINSYITIMSYDGNEKMFRIRGWFRYFKMIIMDNSPINNILKIYCLSVMFMPLRVFKSNWLRVTVILWFLGSIILNLGVSNEYYLNYIAAFGLMGIISLTYFLPSFNIGFSLLSGMISILSIILIEQNHWNAHYRFIEGAVRNENIANQLKIIKSTTLRGNDKPSIAFVGCMDRGENVVLHAVPGIKYWARQNGATSEMEFKNHEDVFHYHPDIVVVPAEMEEEYTNRLISSGYELAFQYGHFIIQMQEESKRKLYVKKVSDNYIQF